MLSEGACMYWKYGKTPANLQPISHSSVPTYPPVSWELWITQTDLGRSHSSLVNIGTFFSRVQVLACVLLMLHLRLSSVTASVQLVDAAEVPCTWCEVIEGAPRLIASSAIGRLSKLRQVCLELYCRGLETQVLGILVWIL